MKITIWGCRGSIASPGQGTIRYGGETTCLEVCTEDGQRVIIDAGSGIRRLGESLLKKRDMKPITLLVTHAHWDHLAGFPFFRPAYFPEYRIHVCGGPVPQQTLLGYLARQMEPPYFPVPFSSMKAGFTQGCRCDSGTCTHRPVDGCVLECRSVPLNHPDGGYGFKLTEAGRSFVFLTDTEIRYRHPGCLEPEEYLGFCHGADLLIHDAQYTEREYLQTRGWGHSTFSDAVDFALSAGVRRLGLYHHDPARDDYALDRLVESARQRIARAGSRMECFACADGMVLRV